MTPVTPLASRDGGGAPRLTRPPAPAAAAPPGRVVVAGEIVAVHARDAETGWAAGTIAPAAGSAVRFAGADLPPNLIGCAVRATGYWTVHPAHGPQLEVTAMECRQPSDADAVVRYLVGNFQGQGCGPARARRIVAVLGADCLTRLEADPDLVRLVHPGAVGEALAHAVRRWADVSRRDSKARLLAVRLVAAGVSYATVRRIMAYFSTAEAAEVAALRHPYRLLDVPQIGWKTADAIAGMLGVPADDPARAAAACRHALEAAMGEGHSGLQEGELVARAATLLGEAVAAERVVDAARSLEEDGLAVRAGDVLRTPEAADAEWRIADVISRLVRGGPRLTEDDRVRVAPLIDGSGLTPAQRAAVWTALCHGTAALTGRPGSGKTTVLKTYVACCRALGWTVHIVAPTGKAASRATAVTGVPATTVHRLVAQGSVTARALVVDEASMCGAETAAWLLSAVAPLATSVLWCGDADQLASVEHGQVLADLIASERLPVARLVEVHRQALDSRIVENAHRLLDGAPLDLATTHDWETQTLDGVSDGRAADEARQRLLAALRDAASRGLDVLTDVQVLTPTNKGPLGVDALNPVLQEVLNPDGAVGPVVGGGAHARVGDRVVMTRNLYDLPEPVFNGEQGVVVGADARAGRLDLLIEGERRVSVTGVQCLMLRPAWAMTVHRSQGSEYREAILLYDHRAHRAMLDAGVLYTAVTRARTRLTLIGTREAVARTLRVGRRARCTGLAALLRDLIPLASSTPDAS